MLTGSELTAAALQARAWLRTLPMLVLLGGAVAVLAWLYVGQIEATRDARRAAGLAEARVAQAEERSALEAQRIGVAQAATRAQLEARLAAAQALEAAATGRESQIKTALDRLRAAAPGAKVIEVETGDTGPLATSAQPAGGLSGDGAAPAPGGGLSIVAPPPGRACLLYEGDQGRIRTGRAKAETGAGTLAVVATADAYRVREGEPDLHLFGGELRLQSDYLAPPEPPRELRRGLGLRGTCVAGGCAAGVAGAWQPWRHLELSADVSFYGAAAARGAGVSALVRF